VSLQTYLAGVGLNAGLALACALPFALAAIGYSRPRRLGPILLVGVLVVFQNAVAGLPRLAVLGALHWSWQAALLTAAVPFVALALVPGVSLASMGITSRMAPGGLKPAIPALVIAAAVPLVFFALGSRVRLTGEGWAYLLVMPGLAEELLFRGLYQSLLNDALGRPWRMGGAGFGWGLIITSVLFAAANGLVAVDDQLHAHLVLKAAIAPFMLGLVSGWARERTNSVWPSVLGHNLSNLVNPVATLVSGLVR
jgi:membrane protease YdiL (CAAX protease family)